MRKSTAALIAASVLSLAPAPALAKENTPKKKLAPVVHVCKKNDSSVNALACNIYFESRGENINGQMAVGFVTLNRLKHDSYPGSVRKVVYQSSQFSWTMARSGYAVRDSESWMVAQDIAKFLYKIRNKEVLYNKLDPTHGATHFHTKKVKPYWRKFFTKTATIGYHVFYKPKEMKA
ncbi:cell wall hydrolase [Pectobacterium atrosepticum]|uniref:SleB n=1 Tax=Pectobacterium phage phiTE TaxID=1116482 RepID=K9L3Q2_9CAUD|nr:cell wall hydrolase [Pectobacterium atrosepticum]YP_007392495.1 endolysin [Pectobacterium phage phiTE]AEZ66199.1 SleB [Pectobacterium phage phiTE]MCL6318737.1 cell wall hydrolase [Pectobacterium atrosepticum]